MPCPLLLRLLAGMYRPTVGKQECVGFDTYFSGMDVFTWPFFPSTHTNVVHYLYGVP